MKISKTGRSLTLAMALLSGVLASGVAFGHGGWGGGWRGGSRVGVYIGAPIGFNYGYYPYPYYGAPYYGSPYYAPVPVYYPPVQSAPITYTERADNPQTSAPRNVSPDTHESWWYYCVDAKAYYPYVNQCPGGWQRVAPQPPPASK
jgi:hypothetical protein